MKNILVLGLLFITLGLIVLFGLPEQLDPTHQKTTLRINEVMTTSNPFYINTNDYDWIELYNYGTRPIQMKDFGLSDDAKEPFKWTFTNIILDPGQYLIVWASGQDKIIDGQLHTNFKIDSGKEPIILTHSDERTIDSIAPESSLAGYSYGYHLQDDAYVWYPFPTPSEANSQTYLSKKGKDQFISSPNFSYSSGFYEDSFLLDITANKGTIIYYTLDGSLPTDQSLVYTEPILISSESNPNHYAGSLDISYMTTKENEWGRPKSPVFKSTLVRAIAYQEGLGISQPSTSTYFIDPAITSRFDLPIISLATDPDYLFDADLGIYVTGQIFDDADVQYPQGDTPANYNQRGNDWERPVQMSYFSNTGALLFQEDFGMRTHGAWSRANPHKGLRLFAREEYGSPTLDYPLFGNLIANGTGEVVDSFQRFLIRASGNDWSFTLFRDALMQGLIKDAPFIHDLDTQAYQPTVVFINGEYWGIHNLRETVDETMISSHYNIKTEDITILEYDQTLQKSILDVGNEDSATAYNDLIDYVQTHDMSDDQHFNYIDQHIDLNNFSLYMVAETFYGNTDWPGNNIRYWRMETDVDKDESQYGHDGKWRYILYDTDFGFHIYEGMENDVTFDSLAFASQSDGPEWPNPPYATGLFRTLLTNKSFLQGFINTYCDLLNTTLTKDNIKDQITNYSQVIENEIIHHNDRYNNLNGWVYEVDRLHQFADRRTDIMWALLEKTFHLGPTSTIHLSVNDYNKGTVLINQISPLIDTTPFEGQYFKSVPIKVTAIANDGYNFKGWLDRPETSATLELYPEEGLTLTAIFE